MFTRAETPFQLQPIGTTTTTGHGADTTTASSSATAAGGCANYYLCGHVFANKTETRIEPVVTEELTQEVNDLHRRYGQRE